MSEVKFSKCFVSLNFTCTCALLSSRPDHFHAEGPERSGERHHHLRGHRQLRGHHLQMAEERRGGQVVGQMSGPQPAAHALAHHPKRSLRRRRRVPVCGRLRRQRRQPLCGR